MTLVWVIVPVSIASRICKSPEPIESMCSTYASTTTTQAQTLPVGTTETSQSLPKSPDPVSGTEAGAVIESVDTGIPRNVLRNKHTKPEADVQADVPVWEGAIHSFDST